MPRGSTPGQAKNSPKPSPSQNASRLPPSSSSSPLQSLIFKATITPEWWTDRIQPWVHYVPIKVDYSDLHDAFAFFQGDLNGESGEALLAKQIATEGKEWVNTHWRKEDMTAYVFRLYLEWARLLGSNKREADFVYDESMERSRVEGT